MRLLVTIPHYCRRTAEGTVFYGSESTAIPLRQRMVERCITALHQTFGSRQALFGPNMSACNTTMSAQLDVVLITSHDQHLVNSLPRPLFAHYATKVDPRHLGFVCHEFLREHAGRYDYYAYLEDDIEITDATFFHKLRWFSAQFGPATLLQPNRFETSGELNVLKLYIDGDTTRPELARQYQDIAIRPKLLADAFGRTFLFERVQNVHSGCFFLDARQLEDVARSPYFATPTGAFFGPLESAATLPIMHALKVYKPARENAGFLEVHHLGRRFLFADPIPPRVPEPAIAGDPPLP